MEFCIIGIWLICALITIEMYRNKGHGVGYGILVGLLLGPLGVVVAATKPKLK